MATGPLELAQDQVAVLLPKLFSAFGLAMRARKCAVGTEQVLTEVRRGRGRFAILSKDLSQNTHKKLTDAFASHGVPYAVVPCDMQSLAGRFGKSGPVAAAVLTDARFLQIFQKNTGNTRNAMEVQS